MPYPAQIDRDTAIDAARDLIEAEGIENLSLAKLAAGLGIKAPSLYHHFSGKAELLQGVNLRTSQALVAALRQAVDETAGQEPRDQFRAMASAYRAFAFGHPVTFVMAFSALAPEDRPDPALLEQLALPLQASMASLVGEDTSLGALRGLWALVHGFAILELNGQFQRGGDLEQTLTAAVDAYITGLARSGRSAST